MQIQSILAGALVLGLAGLPAFAATQQTFAEAHAKAKAAQAKAASVGGEWRDVGALLKRASEAAAQGELDRALALTTPTDTEFSSCSGLPMTMIQSPTRSASESARGR